MTEFGPWQHDEGLDSWEQRRHWPGNPPCCSFCGSLDPEYFLERLEEGYEAGPTDKPYKAYLHLPDGEMAGKFYFQHFDESQRGRFVALLNEKKIRIGYPGHFYRLPYFIKVVGSGDTPPDQ